jgi:hypothetical protein
MNPVVEGFGLERELYVDKDSGQAHIASWLANMKRTNLHMLLNGDELLRISWKLSLDFAKHQEIILSIQACLF